ncbi:MAG: hypothetical protein ACOVQ6_15360, partial [Brevundimonas sp.]
MSIFVGCHRNPPNTHAAQEEGRSLAALPSIHETDLESRSKAVSIDRVSSFKRSVGIYKKYIFVMAKYKAQPKISRLFEANGSLGSVSA